jgi:GINS complex subunit 2
MALPQSLRTSITPPELELIACEELIDIIPRVSMEKIAFISVLLSSLFQVKGLNIEQGAYGPFRPPMKSRIPLWMAVNLKLKRKCLIVAPDWLSVGSWHHLSSRVA